MDQVFAALNPSLVLAVYADRAVRSVVDLTSGQVKKTRKEQGGRKGGDGGVACR